jgi:hypothetical protein
MSTLVTTAQDEAEIDPATALAAEEKAGTWHNLANFRVNQPQKLKLVRWLLGKGMVIRDVCKVAEVSATTVCQVLRDPEYAPAIAAQKAHVTDLTKLLLRVGVEKKLESWTAPDAKAPDVFDLKLLRDMAALDDGGATARMEVVHKFLNPDNSATLKLLEASAAQSGKMHGLGNGATVQDAWSKSVHEVTEAEVCEMGLDSQKLHALPALTDQPAVPDEVGESEGLALKQGDSQQAG